MTLNDYQAKAQQYGIYDKQYGLFYLIMGLTGEAGETANKLKKILRDNNGMLNADNKLSISNELGDVLWYISEMACTLGIPLDKIAQDNLNKLEMRKRSNNIKGSGDYR